MQNNNKGQHIIGVAAIFIATTLISTSMLLVALLLYIAELTGSLIGALLILGFTSASIAGILYFSTLRPQISAMREEISTIYEMAHLARTGYDWVIKRINLFIQQL